MKAKRENDNLINFTKGSWGGGEIGRRGEGEEGEWRKFQSEKIKEIRRELGGERLGGPSKK